MVACSGLLTLSRTQWKVAPADCKQFSTMMATQPGQLAPLLLLLLHWLVLLPNA
jgi:hypothetical protein